MIKSKAGITIMSLSMFTSDSRFIHDYISSNKIYYSFGYKSNRLMSINDFCNSLIRGWIDNKKNKENNIRCEVINNENNE